MEEVPTCASNGRCAIACISLRTIIDLAASCGSGDSGSDQSYSVGLRLGYRQFTSVLERVC